MQLLTILKHLHNMFFNHRQNKFPSKATCHPVQCTLTSHCIAKYQLHKYQWFYIYNKTSSPTECPSLQF